MAPHSIRHPWFCLILAVLNLVYYMICMSEIYRGVYILLEDMWQNKYTYDCFTLETPR